MAYITKAFLLIFIREKDRDVLRFLWIDNFFRPNQELKFVTMRMTRVPFGASPSPFLLAATIRHHLRKYEDMYPEVTSALKECLYVDDLICGAQSAQAAASLSMKAKEILQDAGMDLCKWTTNSEELRDLWRVNMQNTENGNGNVEIKNQNTVLKVLVLTWQTEPDIFVFDLSNLLELLLVKRNTKRSVLQSTAHIFDPIGFLSPFTIRVKCLFQRIWERGLKWDKELPDDLKSVAAMV